VRTADGKCTVYVDPADKLQNTDLQWVCTPTSIAELIQLPHFSLPSAVFAATGRDISGAFSSIIS